MAKNSKIEWTHHTFNPWRGCTKVSPGCQHCYAETLSKRNPSVLGEWGPEGKRVIASEAYWRQPLKWNEAAQAAGERHRVFCASLADVFEDRPELLDPRKRLFRLIHRTPSLDWLLLTKRPQNVISLLEASLILEQGGDPDDEHFFAEHGESEPNGATANMLNEWIAGDAPPNVWLGVSIEDQQRADERIPILLRLPAAVRFLSCEPLLGPIRISSVRADGWDGTGIHWVIVGGESGPGARPMQAEWVQNLRNQCTAAGCAFFFKQWGDWLPSQQDGADRELLNCCDEPLRVGKQRAGRLLDGREWSEFPHVTA